MQYKSKNKVKIAPNFGILAQMNMSGSIIKSKLEPWKLVHVGFLYMLYWFIIS